MNVGHVFVFLLSGNARGDVGARARRLDYAA